jgi:hypothetical protein
MHLLISRRKTCWTTLEGTFVVLTNIARMRINISYNTTKGKQQLKQLPANPKFLTAMMQANTKFVMRSPMLTVDALHKAGKPCVELQNSYINNYMSDQDIIVSYKDHHFLVSDNIFLISWFNLYDLFNLNALDVLTHK